MRTIIILAAAAIAALPAGASAHGAKAQAAANVEAQAETEITVAGSMLRPALNNDSNGFWIDYRTDVSEAKRELASDLSAATDDEDVREAWAEYYREIKDAQKDYTKEMNERGYRVVDFEAGADLVLALRN